MLRRTIFIYLAYFAQFFKARLAYRADFLASLAANVVVGASGMLFIVFLIDGNQVQALRGWSREQVLFIYGYSMIGMAIFNTVALNLYSFADRYVIQGNFDRVLLRPLNSLCQVLFESFNIEAAGSLCLGIAVIFYSARKLHLVFGPWDYLWLVISGISGGIILLSVFVLLASQSFHFEDRLGVTAPVYNLINFSRYPLTIFHPVIQFILSWVVPFGFVAFYPATHFFRQSQFAVFCYLTPVVAVFSFGIASASWCFGVSRYSSTGN